MKLSRFLSAIISMTLVLFICTLVVGSFEVTASDNSYGTDATELLELYEEYYDTDFEALYFEESTSEYSSYCAIKEQSDVGLVCFYGDEVSIINISDLQKISGFNEEELSLKCSYSKRNEYWNLRMNFFTHNHITNYEAAIKITDAIAEKYDIKSAYIEVGGKNIIRNNRICWNDIRRIDEFGIESSLIEEITSKQIADLNSDIEKNGYNASIDKENGNVCFANDVTEKEKLQFAVWFKQNYGFYAFTYSAAILPETTPKERKELFYTDIKGDVNNDGLFNISDLVTLQKYLLGNGTLSNWKNADLCNDNRIDVFDMCLMRRLLIEQL